MRTRTRPAAPPQRLRVSPNFALTFTLDGRPYVAKDSEPYIQYWLTERERILLSMFAGRGGADADDAIDHYLRYTRALRNTATRARLRRVIADLCAGGVLIGARDDTSRYTAGIVASYVAHRPFPRELSDAIIAAAPVQPATRVLDLAGGPGDLALALARASRAVSLMDLSKGFVTAAARRARQQGLALNAIHDSCNRLLHRDEPYDVVTISQALHWLDDVMVCRGICRCLQAGGSFFVVLGAFEVDDQHPLAYILGDRSILGHRAKASFRTQAQALMKRLTLLFDALDAPDVQRVDLAQPASNGGGVPLERITPAGACLYRQRRPMDAGFARAFLTEEHIAVTGQTPAAFWNDLESRCKAVAPESMVGSYDWTLLHFRRGGARLDPGHLESCAITPIGYSAPVTQR